MSSKPFRSQLWTRVEKAQTRVEKGKLVDVLPLLEEQASIAAAEDTRRAALASAQPVLNPPSCILGQIVGDETNARGALPPSAARSTLTRDARAKAKRQRQEMLSSFPLLAWAAS